MPSSSANVEAVGPCQHELGIVQREGGRVAPRKCAFTSATASGSPALNAAINSLAWRFELIDVRVFAQSARRLRLFHNELLSRLRISVSRCARCPLARAEKSSLQLQIETSYLRGDAVLPADTVAA